MPLEFGRILRSWLRSFRGAPRASHSGVRVGYAMPDALADWFRVLEIDDVEAYAGDLFRRCFRDAPPTSPRHYVARVEVGGQESTIGYIHYFLSLNNVYLCGGMCVDDRMLRRLSSVQRAKLKAAGGIAEQMLRYTFADLADARAIFGYVGDKRAERVDLRAGFQHTGVKHLIVFWPRELSESEQRVLVDRVAKLGPF